MQKPLLHDITQRSKIKTLTKYHLPMRNKKIMFYPCLILTILSCNNETKGEKIEKMRAHHKTDVDLLIGRSPKEFSAKTTDGSVFNSKENKGKFWAIFVYEGNYLTKSESYDMVAELNQTHKLFGNKISMIGLVNGFSDDESELKKLFTIAKLNFKQIDNTEGPGKEKPINDNVFCTPAKILIDPNGKVVYNGCGGKTETFNYKLDSLIKADKL